MWPVVHAGTETPLWTEWLTGVKTLPSRNFVAGGNDWLIVQYYLCWGISLSRSELNSTRRLWSSLRVMIVWWKTSNRNHMETNDYYYDIQLPINQVISKTVLHLVADDMQMMSGRHMSSATRNLQRSLTLMSSACRPCIIHTSSARHETSVPRLFQVKQQRTALLKIKKRSLNVKFF